ncbi:hypothetical protein LTR66_006041 [Elasticomyces elasticus]|nr:hypothetical protein LTR66_006041 [Elasticomyces elasticus]
MMGMGPSRTVYRHEAQREKAERQARHEREAAGAPKLSFADRLFKRHSSLTTHTENSTTGSWHFKFKKGKEPENIRHRLVRKCPSEAGVYAGGGAERRTLGAHDTASMLGKHHKKPREREKHERASAGEKIAGAMMVVKGSLAKDAKLKLGGRQACDAGEKLAACHGLLAIECYACWLVLKAEFHKLSNGR